MQAAVMEDSNVVDVNMNDGGASSSVMGVGQPLQQQQQAPAFTYDDLFPALPESTTPMSSGMSASSNMRVASMLITQVFHVPYEERKLDSEKFGEGESLRTCQMIMKDCGAHIEISSGKDQSLTFLVTGKMNEVMAARRKILIHFQAQASKQIAIPKEHHRWILGKKGERLRDLEKLTGTKINVPNITEESDNITISGTKEGIEKAEHEIRTISGEQSKRSVGRISVPKIYHPFILGPFNENLNRLQTQTGASINVPPQSVMKDEIVIIGEKDDVSAARQEIENIYQDMERKCTTVSVEVPKTQHKYVMGSKCSTIMEILQLTGVSVEMPPTDSRTDTITLRGPQEKLGQALNTVYEKANSLVIEIIDAPGWIHKYIIGRKGANIKEMSADNANAHVEFVDNKIKIEGPPDQVGNMKALLQSVVEDYLKRITFVEISINPDYCKHIIGKAGASVNRLKEELDVSINIEENTNNRIRIEGPLEGVQKAQSVIQEKIDKLENEKEKDVVIDRRLYRQIIGSKGDNIREIRDKFKQIQIVFPAQNENTDIVKLRGPKEEVDKCQKYLIKVVKDIQESSFILEVPIFKQFHKFIIGKGGANIKKIRDETQTRIDLPAEGDKNEMIVITGKKENVLEARDRIQNIQSELADVITEEVKIDPKFYNSIIGAGGKLIASIQEECGGVTIRFPNPDSKMDKVAIRGPKEDVEKAKAQLLELANERQISSYTAEVRAKPQHHKFLIGKNGASIKKIRDLTGARIVIPGNNDEDKEAIVIIGKEESVKAAKAQLEALIKDIDNITEGEINVNPKYHKHFVAKRGEVLHRITDECGGVMISFPRPGVDSDLVTLKGAKECIEAAKARIQEIVNDLEAQVTIECIIPQCHHRIVMGSRGSKVQVITAEHDVHIKFPDRDTGDGEQPETNGDEDPEAVKPCDIIRITGHQNKCEAAKQALLDLIPISEEMEVAFDLHRSIIGQKGSGVKELMSRFDVHIELSPPDLRWDYIKIRGTPINVEEAKKAIALRVEALEADRKDRELRSFELKIEVDPEFHPKIIGRRGAVIHNIRAAHNVQIAFPKKEDAVDNIITIQGYETATQAAKEDILKIVGELTDMYKETVDIDSRVHSRLIGQRGRNIRKIMDDFKVEIKFAKQGDPNPDAVIIMGAEEAVLNAKDHILNLEEEYIQDVQDAAPVTNNFSNVLEEAFSRSGHGGGGANKEGFVVQGAPWQNKAPNTESHEDFPDFGIAPVVPDTPMSSAWGQPR